MRIRTVVSALAAMVLAVSVSPSFARQSAQNKAAPVKSMVKSPVKTTAGIIVATINGAPIHSSDLDRARGALSLQYRNLPIKVIYKTLLNQVIDRKLIVSEARSAGLDKDPEFVSRLAALEERLMQEMFMSRRFAAGITEEKLRQRHDSTLSKAAGEKEVRARHILVKSETEAIALIAELNKGADFAATAKRKSTGPSATKGGDLGFFKRGAMVKPFSAAAFRLKKGEFTQKPVKTRFGWHIIKVVDIRQAAAPSFEKRKPQLRRAMSKEIFQSEVKRLRQAASIERFNPDGSPLTADR